nr:ATP-binding cassette domain-containing protein [uncultured Cohaesibacter sp.]
MGDVLLEMAGVDFAYGERAVLASVDITCKRQQVLALMGPSGCGKTTLLSLAMGLLEPDCGAVVRHTGRVAAMFQDPLLLPWRNARDNVAFALKGQEMSRRAREEKALAMLAAVGLPQDCHQQFPHQLSGGMRQRVSLARALVGEPELLLLDEPFHALDHALVGQMLTLLEARVRTRGMGILMVTHDARDAAILADRTMVLSSSPARIMASFDRAEEEAGQEARSAFVARLEQALVTASNEAVEPAKQHQ